MWFVEQFGAAIVGCIAGFFFSQALFHGYTKQKYGGWKVLVKNNDKLLTTRQVGPKKAEQVLDDVSDLAVFIKGVVSPYCHLSEDVISEKARETGLFKQLDKDKTWVVDISKNPTESHS